LNKIRANRSLLNSGSTIWVANVSLSSGLFIIDQQPLILSGCFTGSRPIIPYRSNLMSFERYTSSYHWQLNNKAYTNHSLQVSESDFYAVWFITCNLLIMFRCTLIRFVRYSFYLLAAVLFRPRDHYQKYCLTVYPVSSVLALLHGTTVNTLQPGYTVK
jgi:hypothetical protein